jgi:hypothetical protein
MRFIPQWNEDDAMPAKSTKPPLKLGKAATPNHLVVIDDVLAICSVRDIDKHFRNVNVGSGFTRN